MQVRTIEARSAAELEKELAVFDLAQGEVAFRPTLAIVFASEPLVTEEIISPFASRGIDVFGGSSNQEIVNEHLYRGTIVTMLLDLERSAYSLRFHPPGDSSQIGARVAQQASESFDNPLLLMLVGGSGSTIDVDTLLRSLFAARPALPVFGGLASPYEANLQPPLFDQEQVHRDGVLALVFDNDRVDMRGVAVSGWRAIGTPKRITKAHENVVYEIEGIKAAEFYRRYFQVDPTDQSQILEVTEYPIRLIGEDGVPVMRTAGSVNPDTESVSFGGRIPEGSMFRFCSPNIVETIKHTVAEFQSFKAASDVPGADGIILFDCAIRARSFGSYMRKEIQVIKELWDVPLVGFCSWGEIGNEPGASCGFHNTTISLVLIRDRETPPVDRAARTYSGKELEGFVESRDDRSVEVLEGEIERLRKQKTILSNFLHLTSDDLEAEQRKSEDLLLNILPASIADRLKDGERRIADRFDEVTVLFADLVGFTPLSKTMSADKLVQILNRLFSSFDELAHKYRVEKIKTIGDAYMAVSGLPEPTANHAQRALKLATGLLKVIKIFNERYDADLNVRIGLNTGPVVAGVIGRRKFTYDLWGDTVNVASRMESHGVPGRIHVSKSTHDLLKDKHSFESRGTIEVKGQGAMETFLYRV